MTEKKASAKPRAVKPKAAAPEASVSPKKKTAAKAPTAVPSKKIAAPASVKKIAEKAVVAPVPPAESEKADPKNVRPLRQKAVPVSTAAVPAASPTIVPESRPKTTAEILREALATKQAGMTRTRQRLRPDMGNAKGNKDAERLIGKSRKVH